MNRSPDRFVARFEKPVNEGLVKEYVSVSTSGSSRQERNQPVKSERSPVPNGSEGGAGISVLDITPRSDAILLHGQVIRYVRNSIAGNHIYHLNSFV
jgi:hypothetical protein